MFFAISFLQPVSCILQVAGQSRSCRKAWIWLFLSRSTSRTSETSWSNFVQFRCSVNFYAWNGCICKRFLNS